MKRIILFLVLFFLPFSVSAEEKIEYVATSNSTIYQEQVLTDIAFKEFDAYANLLDVHMKLDGMANPDCSEVYGGGIQEWINNAFMFAKYIGLALVVILTTMDFLKVVAGDKDDGLKNAFNRFIKRCIAVFLLFLTPVIINFVFDILGDSIQGSDGSNIDVCTDYIE